MTRAKARGVSGIASVTAAMAVASLAGMVLLLMIGRLLSPADFGLFVAFWGVLFGLGSSLSTIEQETARRAAAAVDEDGPTAGAVTAAAALIASAVAALTLIPPVSERLYGDASSVIGLVVVAATIGFSVQFAVRGLLMGTGSIRDYAGIVVAEALSRLVLVGVVALAFDLTLPTAAVAVAAGSYAWLLWARRAGSVIPRTRPNARQLWPALRRAGSLMLGAALTASMVTGFPTMVTILTGSPSTATGAVFAALTVSRVPLLVVSPLQAMAVPTVLRWNAAKADGRGSPLRRMLALGTGAFVVLSAAGGIVGWYLGPQIVRLVYGSAYEVGPGAVALLVASACILAWVLLLSAALVALAAYRRMITMWLVAVTLTVVWLVASPLGTVESTAVGALVGPCGAIAYALPTLWSMTRRKVEAPAAIPMAN